jgi:hypothetical protein
VFIGKEKIHHNFNDIKSILTEINVNNNLFYPENTIGFLKKNNLFQYQNYHKKYSRYCPSCLSEGKYHRSHWFIAPVIICSIHKKYLREYCFFCLKRPTYMDLIHDNCKYCGKSFSSAPSFYISGYLKV